MLIALSQTSLAQQDTIRVMHYNILQYGNTCANVNINSKNTWLSAITGYYKPDIFTVNEMAANQAYAANIQQNALTYQTMERGDYTNQAGGNLTNMIFYNPDILGYVSNEIIGGNLRDVNAYTLFVKSTATDAGSDTVFITCIVAHLKAGSSSSDESQRMVAATSIMNWISTNNLENVMVMGDFNLSDDQEDAYFEFVNNSNTTINLTDPVGLSWTGSNYAIHQTQSPRQTTNDCGVGGGMDDRFDFILFNNDIDQGSQGVEFVADSYEALGNDGLSYNDELACNGIAVPSIICSSLKQMSDHLPVVMELAIPEATTSIEDLLNQIEGLKITLLTQPFNESLSLHLKAKDISQPYKLSVSNLLGQTSIQETLRLAQKNTTLSFPTAQWPKGVYILTIQSPSGEYVSQKIIKQ